MKATQAAKSGNPASSAPTTSPNTAGLQPRGESFQGLTPSGFQTGGTSKAKADAWPGHEEAGRQDL